MTLKVVDISNKMQYWIVLNLSGIAVFFSVCSFGSNIYPLWKLFFPTCQLVWGCTCSYAHIFIHHASYPSWRITYNYYEFKFSFSPQAVHNIPVDLYSQAPLIRLWKIIQISWFPFNQINLYYFLAFILLTLYLNFCSYLI